LKKLKRSADQRTTKRVRQIKDHLVGNQIHIEKLNEAMSKGTCPEDFLLQEYMDAKEEGEEPTNLNEYNEYSTSQISISTHIICFQHLRLRCTAKHDPGTCDAARTPVGHCEGPLCQ